jgi:DNA-binding TFAR19-related protein (PDSD5 family)
MNNDVDVSQFERQLQEQAALNKQLKQQLVMLEAVAKQKMSKEAISRYGNLKVAHPETAVRAIALIAQAVSSGQVRESITDGDFKTLLQSIQQGKKEFKFRR